MKRKIKSVTLFKNDLIHLSFPGASNTEKGYKYSYTEMDQQDNVILEIKYDPSGKVEEKYIFRFDNKGNLLEEISYLTDDEIAEHKTYEWDDKNKIIRSFKLYADDTKDQILYHYDLQGHVTEKTTTDSEDEIESREIMEWKENLLVKKQILEFGEMILEETNEYDEAGNLTANIKWTSEEGKTKIEYYYDEKKQLIKALTYDNNGKLINKTMYLYNEEGKFIQADFESARNKTSTIILYDDHGNAIEQTETNEHGEINNRAVRKFNEQGDVIETSVIIDFHGQRINEEYILSYEYEYFETD
jgi:antitoxin component YwqK of YwqJK toxin-antitoxin module